MSWFRVGTATLRAVQSGIVAVIDRAQTITGLLTFDRDTGAPFAVVSGAAKVAYLDADLLDGQEAAAFSASGHVHTLSATDRVLGRVTAGAGDVEEIPTTGSGNVVRATSPTLVTPALGTPASGVATNLTGTAAGLTAGNVTTNANLTGPITSSGNATAVASQTGTGTKFVMDTSPTLSGAVKITDGSLVLTDADIAHGITDWVPTSTYGSIAPLYPTTYGGLAVVGVTDGDASGLGVYGIIGVTDPADNRPAIFFQGYKKGTTSPAALAALETVIAFQNANTNLLVLLGNGNGGMGGVANPLAKLHIDQPSTTAAIPTLRLKQADLSEEFIRFESTVGAGNPINTTALGAYYGRVRVYVEGVGIKWLALYDT